MKTKNLILSLFIPLMISCSNNFYSMEDLLLPFFRLTDEARLGADVEMWWRSDLVPTPTRPPIGF